MHQYNVHPPEALPNQRITLPLSDAARASLAAVRAAQQAARARAHRESRRSRIQLAAIAGGIAIAFFVFGPRARRHEAASSSAGPIAAREPTLPSPVIGVGPEAVVAPSTSPPMTAPEPPSTAIPVTNVDLATVESACGDNFKQRRWRQAIDACTQLFAAHPNDGALALKIAQAHHARARLAEASSWAKRAIALDPALAEAFVIVAHAEAHAGEPAAAVQAYRHYLSLAPRGWHASEARAAVRARARQEHASRDGVSSPPG